MSRSRRHKDVRLTAAALVLFLTGCAGERPSGSRVDDPGPIWEANATVLEDRTHGPELCLGAIALSLPPQCGGIPLADWDWDRVEDEERSGGAAFGDYRIHGTFDGETFTVTEVLGPARYDEDVDEDEFKAPCPEPPGGWPVPDPARTTEEDLARTVKFAESRPDSAGSWIDQPPKEFLTPEEQASIVVTAVFTGDLERHERELREYWGGPLCVWKNDRTERELGRIQDEVHDSVAEELGLMVLASDTDVTRGQVVLEVVVAPREAQRSLDQRYGGGVVRLEGALERVGP